MKAHTKIYLDSFGYTTADWIPCESCGATAVDIHHIDARGMGGSRHHDTIENLMALCRYCHIEFGDKKQYVNTLKRIHFAKLKSFNIFVNGEIQTEQAAREGEGGDDSCSEEVQPQTDFREEA